jgi:hypothetical protein
MVSVLGHSGRVSAPGFLTDFRSSRESGKAGSRIWPSLASEWALLGSVVAHLVQRLGKRSRGWRCLGAVSWIDRLI